MQGNFNEPPYSKTQNLSQKLPSQQKGLNIRAQQKGLTLTGVACGLNIIYFLSSLLHGALSSSCGFPPVLTTSDSWDKSWTIFDQQTFFNTQHGVVTRTKIS